MTDRRYGDYCPIACALDVVGERWALLVVRELLGGPMRFTDLKAALPGISPNVLTQRLRELELAGVVERAELPPPAARSVFVLTAEGRELQPVLGSLARWGVSRLPAKPPAVINPTVAVRRALLPFADLTVARGAGERYRLVLNGQGLDIVDGPAGVTLQPCEGPAALTLEGPTVAIVHAGLGVTPLRAAIANGDLHVTGDDAALERFIALFGLDRAAGPISIDA
jgi:DNA-binding HxlR family transcriptional regulator